MTLEQTHPELPAEQAYVAHAYDCMGAMYERVASFGGHGRNDFERLAFEQWQTARMAALSDTISALVFGRIDQTNNERYYIGRHHVMDGERETVVVDWRAPVARAFYRAGASDPMGLRSRRHFLLDGRDVLGISDDHLDHEDDIHAPEILQVELNRQTPGRMRDIVATIQAEQDRIIRAPMEDVLIVQGGPGSGKTAIGLHRASYLIYEHREELTKRKVLIVGPNPTFMRYISQVLPSLGETAVRERTIHELAPIVQTEPTTHLEGERIRGDARMAEVLRRALAARIRLATSDAVIPTHGARVTLTADEVNVQVERIRGKGVAHTDGRRQLRDALLMKVYRAYQRRLRPGSLPLGYDEIARQVRKEPAFTGLLDSVWASVGAKGLVTEVVTKPAALAAAADGILSADEQRAALRPRGQTRRWTPADRILLDEASALVDGPPDQHGHVVVDEAQDLSPMQLRMLARRTVGSMTVLGDLAQATGPWGHRTWDEVAEHLPGAARVEELTLGYRVSPAIMEVAANVLAVAMPGLNAPRSVRAEPGTVHVAPITGADGDAVPRLAQALRSDVEFAAIIAPDDMVDDVRASLAAAGVAAADAREEDMRTDLTVVPASIAKGLEFDGVLLVEPAAIVAQGGLNLLFICLTRAMRSLVIAHTEAVPDELGLSA